MRLRNVAGRDEEKVRDVAKFVIAVEGAKAERLYFERFQSPRLYIKTLHPEGVADGASDPLQTLQRLNTYIAENEEDFLPGDSFWLVCDRDEWEASKFHQVMDTAKSSRFKHETILSNPCFELWLHLHYAEYPEHRRTRLIESPLKERPKQMKQDLHEASEGRGLDQCSVADFGSRLQAAIKRARELDESPENPIPDCPSTRLYLLAERLLELCPRYKEASAS